MAGYEVLTEGRGSNSGTCIINLKNWSDRKRTARQIIVDLEEKCRKMSNVKLEFFEPPAVPGFGTAGGISMLVLDKTFSADYQRLEEVTDKFMAALKKRKEVTNLFTFYAANYPQYELIINNDVAMQKGVSIKAAMDNLNILIGSTWEQGFIRFNLFYKVFVQARPEFRRYPEDLDNLFVKNDKGEMVPYSAFMTIKKKQGLNEITRYNLYTSAAIQLRRLPATAPVKPSRRSRRSAPRRCLAVSTSAGRVSLTTRRERGTRPFISSSSSSPSSIWYWSGNTRASSCRWP